MGCKGVAECVWTDIFGDTGFLCEFFNHVEHHDAGNIIAPSRQEYIILVPFFYFSHIAVYKPILYFFDGSGRNRYQTLLTAFALYFDESFFKIEVGKFQVA